MEQKSKFSLAVLLAVLALFLVLAFLLKSNVQGNVVVETSNMTAFIQCLNSKNVRLFGVKDEQNTIMQASIFKEDFSVLNFVDCSLNRETCEGVIVYPTWQINDIIIHGGLSIDALSSFSGCSLKK